MMRLPLISTLFPYTTLFRSMNKIGNYIKEKRKEAGLTQEEFAKRSDRKSTRLNSSHVSNSYAVFCLKKKNIPRHLRKTNDSNLLSHHPKQDKTTTHHTKETT